MKPRHCLLLLATLLLVPSLNQAQSVTDAIHFQPKLDFDNVHVYEMESDSLSSAFIIWVKKEVEEHYHEKHSEVVYVLEGKGLMWLDGEEQTIEEGDCIFIPKGTPHRVKVIGDQQLKVLSIQSPKFDGNDRVFTGK